MHPIAQELNETLKRGNPAFLDSLASFGREIFFPKGILTQSAEAKLKAHRFNATIGTAREKGSVMHLRSVMDRFSGLTPDEALNYAPSYGVAALRKVWAEEMLKKNPGLTGRNMSLPVVTAGLTHGLSVAADMFIEPGDVIVMPDKLWGNYRLIFELRKGAKIKTFPLYDKDGGVNIRGYEEALKKEAVSGRVITLLNFPNNPTGYTPTVTEMKRIAEILIRIAESGTRVVALSDDAYFGLFYEADTAAESLFALIADRHPNLIAVKLDGATKEDFVWGFRVGFITVSTRVTEGVESAFYEAVEKKLGGTVRSNISNAPAPSQAVLLHAMKDERYEKEKADKRDALKRRALKVKQVVNEKKYSDYFTLYPFNSGYFMCVRLREGLDAEKFRKRLLDDEGIGVISIDSTDIRVAFSSVEEDDIEELFNAMLKCAVNMSQNS
ncbi:MAG: aminotransferase class I/II-fold pyridoxal phosphate-dependent enzyme [Nitrospirota bacterium]